MLCIPLVPISIGFFIIGIGIYAYNQSGYSSAFYLLIGGLFGIISLSLGKVTIW
jgi:hypothetical protein